MNKAKFVSVLDKKVISSDNECRNLEKTFYKGGLDQKTFMEEYINKRKDFHRYSILKVKVSLS